MKNTVFDCKIIDLPQVHNVSGNITAIENKKNILDIDNSYLKGLKFHYVSSMNEVIDIAITKQKVRNYKW
mgnify:CR=1 FL=1